MGINNLLKFVSDSCENDQIFYHRNKSYAIDMYCFIYKSLYHDDYMSHLHLYMNLFLKSASHLYLVFDGKPPESKNVIREKRKADGVKYARRSITQEIIQEIIERYKRIAKVSIVLSPQESDSQLAYIHLKGLADIVVTEDSDLIVHGCNVIMFKLKPRGDCVIYRKDRLIISWNFDVFRWICILCGCDYLKGGLKGLGLWKAQKIFKSERFNECMMIEEFMEFLEMEFGVSEEFIERFKKAEHSFTSQNVVEIE